jgi:hypothetical protein
VTVVRAHFSFTFGLSSSPASRLPPIEENSRSRSKTDRQMRMYARFCM